MQFPTLKVAVAALAICGDAAMAQLTASQIVDNIRALTSKSQALQAPAQSINIINGPLIVVGLGPFPPLIAGFANIVSTATLDIAAMQGPPPSLTAADSTIIFNAFREFVRVHQVLLNILIGKAGLFQQVPLIGAPVAAVLTQVEKVVDTIAFGLIDMAETSTTDFAGQAASLDMTIQTAISKFKGLSLPKREELVQRGGSYRLLRA